MWHMTCDTWHVTRDTWHVTCDMLWGVNILSKFQLPSSYCLWFMIFWWFGGKGWLTQSINNEAVCRTAPATPGLLTIKTSIAYNGHNAFLFSESTADICQQNKQTTAGTKESRWLEQLIQRNNKIYYMRESCFQAIMAA